MEDNNNYNRTQVLIIQPLTIIPLEEEDAAFLRVCAYTNAGRSCVNTLPRPEARSQADVSGALPTRLCRD